MKSAGQKEYYQYINDFFASAELNLAQMVKVVRV